MIGLLGPPPLDLLEQGERNHEFFAEDGTSSWFTLNNVCLLFERTVLKFHDWKMTADVELPQGTSLEQSEEFLEG